MESYLRALGSTTRLKSGLLPGGAGKSKKSTKFATKDQEVAVFEGHKRKEGDDTRPISG